MLLLVHNRIIMFVLSPRVFHPRELICASIESGGVLPSTNTLVRTLIKIHPHDYFIIEWIEIGLILYEKGVEEFI